MKIDRLEIESSLARTPLCSSGALFGTDKSPYTINGPGHRHPYTAAYHVLFSGLRYREIVFGELGILDNSSMKMWRNYFPKASLYGFDFFSEKLDAARSDELPATRYFQADVSNRSSMFNAFNKAHSPFDVLIDDSTHLFEHQMLFIDVAIDFVRPGGMIIVEDIFRRWPDERYETALSLHKPYLDCAFFLDTKHEKGFSGGTQEPYYDNDKILVLCRNFAARSHGKPS